MGFYNLLPEFGSLPWTLKPVLMFLAEEYAGHKGRQWIAVSTTLLCALAFAYLATLNASGVVFLVCTATVSLASAVVDGLIDGRVAELSVDSESAAASRYLCECGTITGGLVVGTAAWLFGLGQGPALWLTAGTWAA